LSIGALCKAGGVVPRTVRKYIKLGLVGRPQRRGYNTLYPALAVAQLQAIELRGASEADLQALLQPAGAPEVPSPATATATTATPVEVVAPPVASLAQPAGSLWRHLQLMAGLELLVREDATEYVRRAAEEILQRYRVG
jgi:DNA-binding transcriptional MerR regulator